MTRTSGMPMCRRTARGFTLLELMLSLLIMGIMLGLGIGFLGSSFSTLRDASTHLAANLARARVDAMLSRHRVEMVFEGNRIYQNEEGMSKTLVQTLPADARISINGKSLMTSGRERLMFSPLGYTAEKLVHLYDGREYFSIYIPAIGAPFAKAGMLDLDEIRKEGS